MRIDKYHQRAVFEAEDGGSLRVGYDNRGEPYREGICLVLEHDSDWIHLFLEEEEVKSLRDLLNKLHPSVPTKG